MTHSAFSDLRDSVVAQQRKIRVAVATPGTGVFIQETVTAYLEQGCLDTFFTSFVANLDVPGYSLLHGSAVGKQLARREIAAPLLPFTRTRPLPELARTFSSILLSESVTDTVWGMAEKSFDCWVASSLDERIDVLHCYEHCSLRMMERAKELGIFVVYEQPSQHHSFLTPVFNAQLAQFPWLANETTSLHVGERAALRNARRDAELALADLIICNSSFTKKTLLAAGVPASRIQVIPLGSPPPVEVPRRTVSKLRFVYAGTANIRKGIHLLLLAWRQLFAERNDVELLLVGKFDLAKSALDNLPTNVEVRGSIPRSELLQNFCDADVLVLPTLADGFGMVISEAMSRGVCVMAAENSAAPDLITHGHNGLVFASGDMQALLVVMADWADRPNELRAMGVRARQTAAAYQWSDFRSRLVSVVTSSLFAKDSTAPL